MKRIDGAERVMMLTGNVEAWIEMYDEFLWSSSPPLGTEKKSGVCSLFLASVASDKCYTK